MFGTPRAVLALSLIVAALALPNAAAPIGLGASRAWAQDPLVSGRAAAVDAQRVAIGGRVIALMGLDAPTASQSCSKGGARVSCGAQAQGVLDGLLAGHAVVCSVGAGVFRGGAPGRCWADGADVGAQMVAAGWALTSDSVYAPLQAKAKAEGAGLWATAFVRPSAQRRAELGPWVPGLPGVPTTPGVWTGANGAKTIVGGAGACALYSGILSLKGNAKVNCAVISPAPDPDQDQ